MPKYWFGPAGKPLSLKTSDILRAPGFIRELGLNAMEYEAVRGVNIEDEKARLLGIEARKHNVRLSLHAPYFINLAGREQVVKSSIERLKASIRVSGIMEAYIVVFHPGYYRDALSRRDALEKVIRNLSEVVEYREQHGFRNTLLGPETSGKTSQIGDLNEVIEISASYEGVRPVIDFAHLYARHMGRFIVSKDDVLKVVDALEKRLGREYLSPLHSHFSKIEYSRGGERMHHALSEDKYGPEFRHVCEALCEAGVDAVVISESPLLEQDSIVMKRICLETCGESCIVE